MGHFITISVFGILLQFLLGILLQLFLGILLQFLLGHVITISFWGILLQFILQAVDKYGHAAVDGGMVLGVPYVR